MHTLPLLISLFLFFGILLILLSLTSALGLLGIHYRYILIEIDRLIMFVCGALLLMVSGVIFYRIRKTNLPDIPEFQMSLSERRRFVTGKHQQEILQSLVQECKLHDKVHQHTLSEYFKGQPSRSGMYYRLETLRLLGFIEKERISVSETGIPQYTYFLTVASLPYTYCNSL